MKYFFSGSPGRIYSIFIQTKSPGLKLTKSADNFYRDIRQKFGFSGRFSGILETSDILFSGKEGLPGQTGGHCWLRLSPSSRPLLLKPEGSGWLRLPSNNARLLLWS